MKLTDDDQDDNLTKELKRKARVECRAFARLFNSPDGKMAIESLKRDIGWDQAGPIDQAKEEPIHHWLGQRSVIWGILHKTSMGERLLHENETEPTKP
jgi:hypothetical protein